jgi:oxygen-independent coproporphyrinogen-3 oxidase
MAIRSLDRVRNSGFDNFSLDLIFGIPGQTLQSWQRTVETALRFDPPHLSAYSLIFERGTPLFDDMRSGITKEYDPDAEAELYKLLISKMISAGHEHYEISNFALRGYECRHNLNYWRRGEYLAFGPAAHGFAGGMRYFNHQDINKYMAAIGGGRLPIAGREYPGAQERLEEYVMLELRRGRLSLAELSQKFGAAIPQHLSDKLSLLENEKKFNFNESEIILNPDGWLISDEIAVCILRSIH